MISCDQNKITIPKGFVETSPPLTNSPEWRKLNYSNNEYEVKIVSKQLEVKIINQDYIKDNCELKISGGTLIGIDHGEWGGTLKFEPSDTSKDFINIKNGNIKFIFTLQEKIYFLEGLSHLSIREGSLYEITQINDSFSFKKLIDFGDAPEAFAILNNRLLVATFENFYSVKDNKKELIFKNTFWSSLYPNSIAAFNDRNVFVGIRGGIVKLDLVNKTLKFYKKD